MYIICLYVDKQCPKKQAEHQHEDPKDKPETYSPIFNVRLMSFVQFVVQEQITKSSRTLALWFQHGARCIRSKTKVGHGAARFPNKTTAVADKHFSTAT